MVYMRLQEFMEKATACFAKYDIDGTGEVSAWDIKVVCKKHAFLLACMHPILHTCNIHTHTYTHNHTNVHTHP
jgi:hypothetical protein